MVVKKISLLSVKTGLLYALNGDGKVLVPGTLVAGFRLEAMAPLGEVAGLDGNGPTFAMGHADGFIDALVLIPAGHGGEFDAVEGDLTERVQLETQGDGYPISGGVGTVPTELDADYLAAPVEFNAGMILNFVEGDFLFPDQKGDAREVVTGEGELFPKGFKGVEFVLAAVNP